MKAINLEKRILAGLIIGAAILIIVSSVVVWQKKHLPENNQDPFSEANSVEHKSAVNKSAKANADSTAISIGGKKSKSKSGADVTVITWEMLYELDYKTGKMPEFLRKLNNKRVRIPGFIVPLSDDLTAMKEFLLVPNAQACIHVPPPPPNLIIYGILQKALPVEKISNPSWMEGILAIEKVDSEYGEASYRMSVESLEEYKF